MMKILHLSDLHVEPVGKLAYARANTARRMIELTEWLAHHKDEYDAIAGLFPSPVLWFRAITTAENHF